jgi:hypothetical protein
MSGVRRLATPPSPAGPASSDQGRLRGVVRDPDATVCTAGSLSLLARCEVTPAGDVRGALLVSSSSNNAFVSSQSVSSADLNATDPPAELAGTNVTDRAKTVNNGGGSFAASEGRNQGGRHLGGTVAIRAVGHKAPGANQFCQFSVNALTS